VGAPKLKLDLANAAKDDGTVAMLGISKVEDVGAVLGGSLERLTSSGACAGVLGIGLGAVTIASCGLGALACGPCQLFSVLYPSGYVS
jgi:hypothetical protein